jgi:putative NADPH-quinone reductase
METPTILAFNGSPRRTGNSATLLDNFMKGAAKNMGMNEIVHAHQLNIKPCTGCLRCNILKRCSVQDDDWIELSGKILAADVLVFATPVYFHHLPAPLKMIVDRFRSFIHVQITESGLVHTPWHEWKKDFVLILTMGSSDDSDARPIIDLFNFMTSILGKENKLHVIKATRLAIAGQINRSAEDLALLYEKMKLPPHLADGDYMGNQKLKERCEHLGYTLTQK